jgi:hypothetical protein
MNLIKLNDEKPATYYLMANWRFKRRLHGTGTLLSIDLRRAARSYIMNKKQALILEERAWTRQKLKPATYNWMPVSLQTMKSVCNRTDQIIRAQVQKQASKRSNFRTWAHIIPVVNRNHEGFQTNSLTTKIAWFNITHHTLHFTGSSEVHLQHTESQIITNRVHKVAEA